MNEQTIAYVKRQIDEEYERYERRGAPPNGFRQFPDIPAGRYLSDKFFELEQTHIWCKSSLLAAHTDEIPSVGDYLLWERAGVPILIARGRDQNGRLRETTSCSSANTTAGRTHWMALSRTFLISMSSWRSTKRLMGCARFDARRSATGSSSIGIRAPPR
jgi:hypothetical protein